MAFLTLLSAAGPVSIVIVLMVLGELSRRLGAVLKTGKSYGWFYLAAGIVLISVIVRLLSIGYSEQEFDIDTKDTGASLAYTISLTGGVAIGLIAAWRYWGWLVYASDGKTLTPRQRNRRETES